MNLRARQALVAVLGAALCVLMVFLGLWQMQVFESQKSDSTAARAAAAPVDLESNLVDGKVGDLYGRPVSATGTWVKGSDRLVGTSYPLRVVTALRTPRGNTVAVVRGTISSGTTAPAAPSGTQTVSGIVLPSEADDTSTSKSSLPASVRPTLQLQELVQDWPSPLLDGYITQEASQSAAQGLGTAVAKVPDTEGGRVRNQGYALQWWAFSAFGAAATVVGVRSMGRPQEEKKHRGLH